MKVPLIINPVAGRGGGRALAETIVSQLRSLGILAQPEFTNAPRHAEELVLSAAATHDLVLIAGGDGSVNEAINGVMRTLHRPALGIIPIGTGNDFAKMLGLDHNWRLACRRIASAKKSMIDIGRCNGRYFANGIGIGFDAQVAMEANCVHYLHGNAVYFLALLRTLLLRYATPHVTIEHDGGSLREAITLIAAANGRWYGGAFCIAPEANIHDGYLELIVARDLSRAGILRLVPKVLRGTHVRDKMVQVFRTRHVAVSCEVPLPVHADGEILEGGALHLEIEILPGALTVVC